MSLKGNPDTMRHSVNAVHASQGKPRKQAELLDLMLEIISVTVPIVIH